MREDPRALRAGSLVPAVEDGGDVGGDTEPCRWRWASAGRSIVGFGELLSGPRHSVERGHGSGERGHGAGRSQPGAAPPPSEQAHQAGGTYAHDNPGGEQDRRPVLVLAGRNAVPRAERL
jgi:hypothetical protein